MSSLKPRTLVGSNPAIASVAGERLPVPGPPAKVSIDPMGRATAGVRDHLVTVTLELGPAEPRFADKGVAAAVARRSLEGYVPTDGPDTRKLRELTQPSRAKAGVVTNVVVGVEASVVWAGRPDDAAMELVRTTLTGEGYRVQLRERRECTEGICSTDVVIAWAQPDDVPTGWFSHSVCGRHFYRRCAKCKSVYRLTSMNAAGQGPSVKCQVCDQILVEWGSSKIWDAELVTRGDVAV